MVDLTIITAHYKDTVNLLKTYESLKDQTFKNWKFYIVDSFTPNIKNIIGENILQDSRVRLFSLESGIYDAMNYGIIVATTDYIQILNSGSTYSSKSSLEISIKFVNDFHIKKGPMLHFFEMEIIGQGKINNVIKPSRFSHPLKCGHEATIYPNRLRNKIMHNHSYKISADVAFIIDYSDIYKAFFHDFPLVKYPKGGYSDSDDLFLEKVLSNFLILKRILKRFKFISAFLMIIRLVKDVIKKIIFKFMNIILFIK